MPGKENMNGKEENNKELIRKRQKRWLLKNTDYFKNYYVENKEKLNEQSKQNYLNKMKHQIQYKKIVDLKPYQKNAKLHPQSQVNAIARSIEKFGFLVPIVIDDKPGQLASIFNECAKVDVNIEDLSIEHSPGQETGLITLSLSAHDCEKLSEHLISKGFRVHPTKNR